MRVITMLVIIMKSLYHGQMRQLFELDKMCHFLFLKKEKPGFGRLIVAIPVNLSTGLLIQTKSETHLIESNNFPQRHWFARCRRKLAVYPDRWR